MATAVELKDIVKRFPGVLANDHINLQVEEGEIHGLLGENGAGKTTLMNILSGLTSPSEGKIFLHGKQVHFPSCLDAIRNGVDMVHQHFMLVPVFTVAENLVLGNEPIKGLQFDIHKARALVNEMSDRYQLKVDPNVLVRDASVGMQQRVEILKTLFRGVKVLILDEPTSVLTPQEVNELYSIMRTLQKQGVTIIFITHKLQEVMEITDRVSVLRDGRNVATVETKDMTEADLARMMVGRDVLLHVNRREHQAGKVLLKVDGLNAHDSRRIQVLKDVSFELSAGEIVGIAGVAGNGQSELIEAITGLRRQDSGKVYLDQADISDANPRERFYAGLAHIPEDRQLRGLILQFSLLENAILGFEDSAPFKHGMMLDQRACRKYAEQSVQRFDVRTPSVDVATRTLSGGNQQKLIVAREFNRNPKVLIAAQPTRGLDVAAIEFVHERLMELRDQDKAVLLISMELTEILDLSDRILVMFEGKIVGSFTRSEATPEILGLLMAGGQGKRRAQQEINGSQADVGSNLDGKHG
jgi:general nucleoside transport system ATP-binding protein